MEVVWDFIFGYPPVQATYILSVLHEVRRILQGIPPDCLRTLGYALAFIRCLSLIARYSTYFEPTNVFCLTYLLCSQFRCYFSSLVYSALV